MKSRRPRKGALGRSEPEEPSYLDTEIAALEAIVGRAEDDEDEPESERQVEERGDDDDDANDQ